MENKLKHLEFIQNVISRMNYNSFLIKGWCITLIAALFALSANNSDNNFILIIYLVIPVFWLLDGFFISNEKKYRILYEVVSKTEENEIDFSMNTGNLTSKNLTWIAGVFTKTLIPFYGITIIATILVSIFLN